MRHHHYRHASVRSIECFSGCCLCGAGCCAAALLVARSSSLRYVRICIFLRSALRRRHMCLMAADGQVAHAGLNHWPLPSLLAHLRGNIITPGAFVGCGVRRCSHFKPIYADSPVSLSRFRPLTAPRRQLAAKLVDLIGCCIRIVGNGDIITRKAHC